MADREREWMCQWPGCKHYGPRYLGINTGPRYHLCNAHAAAFLQLPFSEKWTVKFSAKRQMPIHGGHVGIRAKDL
jgi:hypothetical protein